jgi:hypothetical protein
MRRAVFAFVLLHSVAAFAQVSVGEEAVSDALRSRVVPLLIAAPAVSIAKDRTGVAIAWTMSNGAVSNAADRVYVARLGASAQAGPVHEMPLSLSANMHAAYPSLAPAPDGNGVVLAWLEVNQIVPARPGAVFFRLDPALTPSPPIFLFSAATATSPAIVRTKGDSTWISALGNLWKLSKDGTLSASLSSIAASDMAIGTDLPQLVGSHGVASNAFTCRNDPGCAVPNCSQVCRIPAPSNFALDFLSLLTTLASRTFNFSSDVQPAIASNGRDVLVTWFQGSQIGGELRAFGGTMPAIAADGDRYVAVWRVQRSAGNHDIVGVAIENDGRLTPLSIATSSADERDPAILALGDGAFLVAYEKLVDNERHIAGRFVTFGRHRAVR